MDMPPPHPATFSAAHTATAGTHWIHRDVRSTPYANEMLYWKCGNSTGYYYAGQLVSRI